MKKRIAVLSSHCGTNLQALIDACKQGVIDAEIAVIMSNNQDAKALERGKKEGIPAYYLDKKLYPPPEEYDNRILAVLRRHKADVVILAGYMKKIGVNIIKAYRGNIFNIHPALLPKYGGKGMYGIHIHRAVLEAKEKETGVTIHRVDENYDTGKILLQCRVMVKPGDTIELLSKRILKYEHILLVNFCKELCGDGVKHKEFTKIVDEKFKQLKQDLLERKLGLLHLQLAYRYYLTENPDIPHSIAKILCKCNRFPGYKYSLFAPDYLVKIGDRVFVLQNGYVRGEGTVTHKPKDKNLGVLVKMDFNGGEYSVSYGEFVRYDKRSQKI